MIATLEVLKKNLFVYVWALPFSRNIVSEHGPSSRAVPGTPKSPEMIRWGPRQTPPNNTALLPSLLTSQNENGGEDFWVWKKMQQNIRNVKWEVKTYIFKPSSCKWLCLSIIMFSAIFNIEMHEDRFLGDLLNKNLQAPCTLLLHPRTNRRHQTPWRDIQVHAGPSRACGRLPQWSSCAAEISLKAEYKMCVLQKILKKRRYPGFSYRLM